MKKTIGEIDTFLMSCRVMGRSAENEIMAQIKTLLKEKNIESIKASYVKTAKNTPVDELFDKLGFIRVSGEINDHKDYMIKVTSLPDTTGVFKTVTLGKET